jgi:hypothetical protein
VKETRSASSGDNLNEVLRVIREEWDAHYSVNMYCDACKLEMIDYAFARADSDTRDSIHINFEQ